MAVKILSKKPETKPQWKQDLPKPRKDSLFRQMFAGTYFYNGFNPGEQEPRDASALAHLKSMMARSGEQEGLGKKELHELAFQAKESESVVQRESSFRNWFSLAAAFGWTGALLGASVLAFTTLATGGIIFTAAFAFYLALCGAAFTIAAAEKQIKVWVWTKTLSSIEEHLKKHGETA